MKKVYNPAIDFIRVISILAVICIHTSTRIIEVSSNDLYANTFTLFLNQAARFSVPLFFLISGFVLELNYSFNASYLTYLKKRLTKILIPYLAWSVLYYYVINHIHPDSFWGALLIGDASYQLYFVPTLLVFYLIFPLLHHYYRYIAYKWTLIVLGIIEIGFLAYDYYVHPLPYFYPLSIAILNYYVFILGMVASHHEKHLLALIKRWKKVLVGITLALMAYVFVEGFWGYEATHNYLKFYSQWRPSVLLYTVALGGILYYYFKHHPIFPSFIKLLAKLSFFVFFVHIIVLENLWKMLGRGILQYDVIFFTLTATISFLLAYLVQKIPLLRKIAGF